MPSGGDKGGDLSAVFSCSDNTARVVLADCVGHGYTATGVARHVHHLLHKFQDIRDTAGLLAALNDAFTLSNEKTDGPLRLTTVVTGTFDGTSGEFNFAYAAHPRMLLWRGRERRFLELGEGLEGFPLGYSSGETYSQQSVRLNHGDLILAFSDGATEVRSPLGEQLTSKGFLGLAERTLSTLPHPLVLRDFSRALIEGVNPALLAVLVYLCAVPFLFVAGLGLVIMFVATAYLLSREYFLLAAMRFRPPAEAKAMRKQNAATVFTAGLIIAAFVSIPIVNLATPLFGMAFMVHMHKRLSGPRPQLIDPARRTSVPTV